MARSCERTGKSGISQTDSLRGSHTGVVCAFVRLVFINFLCHIFYVYIRACSYAVCMHEYIYRPATTSAPDKCIFVEVLPGLIRSYHQKYQNHTRKSRLCCIQRIYRAGGKKNLCRLPPCINCE